MNSFSELLKAALCLEAICRTARGTQMALCKAVVEPYVFTCGYLLMMKDNKWLSDIQEEELKKFLGIVFATTGWKIESEPVKAILGFLFSRRRWIFYLMRMIEIYDLSR